MPLADDPFTRGKCAFKLLQYMAASLPCVASPVGANVDVVDDGRTGLLASTAAQWEAALNRLLGDAALRESMGRAGRRQAELVYDLSVVSAFAADLVERVASEPLKVT
jgi:glycosyltransferase involved in cell wall biosynthesis